MVVSSGDLTQGWEEGVEIDHLLFVVLLLDLRVSSLGVLDALWNSVSGVGLTYCGLQWYTYREYFSMRSLLSSTPSHQNLLLCTRHHGLSHQIIGDPPLTTRYMYPPGHPSSVHVQMYPTLKASPPVGKPGLCGSMFWLLHVHVSMAEHTYNHSVWKMGALVV